MDFPEDNEEGRMMYKGNWKKDIIHGFGIMEWRENNPYNVYTYEGYYENDKEHGFGKCEWLSGESYGGNWENGLQNGSGVMTWKDGSTYEGSFINGSRTGNGTYRWKDGTVYVGNFDDGITNGNGAMTWKDGSTYEGSFINNSRTGNGTYKWTDGTVYVGEFIDGHMEGFGTMTYANGTIYTGSWEDSEKSETGNYSYSYSYLNNDCKNDDDADKLDTKNVSIPWYIKSEMNIWSVWDKGITGEGVTVSVVDDGVARCHPAIKKNFDEKASFDFTDNDRDPSPERSDDWQGTKGASIIAARRNEPVCTVGVAYNSGVGGIRMLHSPVTDKKEAQSLSFAKDHIDVYQISWGPRDDGKTFEGPGTLTRAALREGVESGRDGFGSIFLLASGRGGKHRDDCNADGYATSIYTMAISSVDRNHLRPAFSERCSAILASAYSGERSKGTGLASADMDGESCSQHDESSASASIATGIIAL